MMKSSSKNIKRIRIVIWIIVALIVLGIIYFGFFNQENAPEPVNPDTQTTEQQNPGAQSTETESTGGQTAGNLDTQIPETQAIDTEATDTEIAETQTAEPETESYVFNGYLGNDPKQQDHPKAPERTWVKDLDIPEYVGDAYVSMNGGIPYFDTENLDATPWELYYDLDELGRCTLAEGVFGKETMPTEKRGSISSIKPTGWHKDKYPKDLVDGESLYNRCHLVAFGLSGETANKYNLVTGTRYFNKDGINDFENLMIDYIRETGNHIRYRVTPVFSGENLICDGQLVEAWSIEDEGDGICFCVWSYNLQPGVYIDYLTGDNHLAEK